MTNETEDNKNLTRGRIINVVTNYMNQHRTTERETKNTEILKKVDKMSRYIREHNEIIITTSDKDKKTVIMYRQEEYIRSKSTNSWQDCTSNHAMNQKITTAKNMIRTAERLTDDIYRDTQIRYLEKIITPQK